LAGFELGQNANDASCSISVSLNQDGTFPVPNAFVPHLDAYFSGAMDSVNIIATRLGDPSSRDIISIMLCARRRTYWDY